MSEPKRTPEGRSPSRSRGKDLAVGRSGTTAGNRARRPATKKAPTEPSTKATGKRRGRPPGSVSLTKEIQDTIVNYTRAGGMAYVAAESAGISERTFREWMQRGEGRHPTRPQTPKLKQFAREVRRAEADARLTAEITVMQEDPKYWLKHVARSRPGREGWTDLPGEDRGDGATTFDARAILAAKLDARAAARREELEERDETSDEPEDRPHLRVVREPPKTPRRGRSKGSKAS